MTKEEMAKSYSDDFDNEIYKEIAYDAFLCGFTAKCEPSLPSNLDKAAEKYAWMKEEPLSDGERLSFCFNPRIDAFKAGAKWMTEQGETIDGEVLPLGLWLRGYTNPKTSYPLGTKVVVQIRKKEV